MRPESAISSGDFQSAESSEFQYAKSHRVHAGDGQQPDWGVGNGGAITSTSTTVRQVQFALKLLW
jgi:hypothetical protein